MRISANTVVTIDYILTDDTGNVIDESKSGDFTYLHGAQNIIPGLENALATRTAGDEFSVSLAPQDAYGLHDEAKLFTVERDKFPEDVALQPGMQFRAQGGDGQGMLVTIASVEGDEVTVDGNHPLAGVTLNFQVKVVEVREATAEEVEHGHVHGAGGHHH
jgi:FKBP-type peptidyl-prolyl cis-trans isomerase SlyD